MIFLLKILQMFLFDAVKQFSDRYIPRGRFISAKVFGK
jgi:hypothetical protein